jgi:hypothetical protein
MPVVLVRAGPTVMCRPTMTARARPLVRRVLARRVVRRVLTRPVARRVLARRLVRRVAVNCRDEFVGCVLTSVIVTNSPPNL